MAPKIARNSGDKTDGAKIIRIRKDKGDSAGVSRRPTSIMAKPTGKNTTGLGKDAKTEDSTTPLLEGLQAQRSETLTGGEAASDLYNTTATLGTEAVQYVPPKQMGGDKETERGLKPPDWAEDSGDKLYSLTEKSDLTSESGSSMSSETGNISSSNEPTVRQLRWQRERVHGGAGEEEQCGGAGGRRRDGPPDQDQRYTVDSTTRSSVVMRSCEQRKRSPDGP
ncbi:hypothetical protein NDU88_000907 [Pleurodeles waltl]|uniref:Uncharacterized protein n=1 Tax=Pleurodeles waltl TaxID=8319 RepID=A0AAV7TH79_PLEWA|nr:hypothetical protein NDU88_000907 [Pleurodeles waltl]